MKLALILLFSAILALSTTSQATYAHPAVCFHKTQKCCYNFHPCGFIVKKVRVVKKCDYNVCKHVCKPHCKTPCRYIRKPVRKCIPKSQRVCYKVKIWHGHHYVWKQHCKYISKPYCVTKYFWKKVCHPPVCKKICRRKCDIVYAICVKYRIFHFPKFCPKLECHKYEYSGRHEEPKYVVAKKGKFIKDTEVDKKIVKSHK